MAQRMRTYSPSVQIPLSEPSTLFTSLTNECHPGTCLLLARLATDTCSQHWPSAAEHQQVREKFSVLPPSVIVGWQVCEKEGKPLPNMSAHLADPWWSGTSWCVLKGELGEPAASTPNSQVDSGMMVFTNCFMKNIPEKTGEEKDLFWLGNCGWNWE